MTLQILDLSLLLNESDAGLQEALRTLDERRYVVRGLIPVGDELYYQEQATYTSSHSSTAIEGNPLDEMAAMQVLIEGADPDVPVEVEKAALQEAYELVALLSPDKSLRVDEGLIRTFNSMSLKGLPGVGARNRGKYRPGQNMIVDSATRQVLYVPPPAESVPALMSAYVGRVQEWRERYPGPFAAAMAHFGLVSIHPFDDGNGRTARLVADLLMNQMGWSVEGMLSVNPMLLENRAGYYDVLRLTQGERFLQELDVTPFVRFHTQQLAEAARRLELRAASLNRQRDEWMQAHDFLSPRQVTALMFMLEIGALSSTRYALLTGTSAATALADLGELVRAKLVVRSGSGPNTRYRLSRGV